MKRLFRNITLMVIVFFLLSGCAFMQSLAEQFQPQIYTFNYDGKDFSVPLPKQVPMPPETAVQQPYCFPFGPVCIMNIQYEPSKEYPTLVCWFTEELGVFLFTFFENAQQHTHYLSIKGIPVLVDCKGAQKVLDDLRAQNQGDSI